MRNQAEHIDNNEYQSYGKANISKGQRPVSSDGEYQYDEYPPNPQSQRQASHSDKSVFSRFRSWLCDLGEGFNLSSSRKLSSVIPEAL